MVGDVDPDRVVAKLSGLLGGAPREEVEPPSIPDETPAAAPDQAFKYLAKEQAHVVLGFAGTTFDNPDRFPLEVLAQVLSGQGGRLFVDIREKRALAYRISAFSMEGIDPGYFAVYMATSPDNLDEALQAIRDQLRAVIDRGISPEELARAQRYLVGTHAIGLQRKSAIAAALAFHEAYGQGWQAYRQYGGHVMKVKVDDVMRVARKYLDPRREITAVVKPSAAPAATAARAAAARAGAPPARADDPPAIPRP